MYDFTLESTIAPFTSLESLQGCKIQPFLKLEN